MARKKTETLPETTNTETVAVVTEEPKKVRKPRAPCKKKEVVKTEEPKEQEIVEPQSQPEVKAVPQPEVKVASQSEVKAASQPEQKKIEEAPVKAPLPACPTLLIRNIIELNNAPQRQLLLNDQQIQQLTLEDAQKRFRWIEGTLALVLNYDVVLSDTNIWIELLTGHTSSHSDPRFNARLQFERQLEFISRLTQFRGGRFMMMSETYEEIDRFATQMDPPTVDADIKDEAVARNIAARLAKRLILSQQRENRLRIEGIGAESHHGSFADPAIIRRCVELFASGKKVLLLTNDASVAIRTLGMCDDLQRTNGIEDEAWDETYAPLRPMVMTFDDLKTLDAYTRQYHFLQMAAGKAWMEDVPQKMEKHNVEHLTLWEEGFRAGDRYSEKKMQQMQQQKQQNNNNQPKQQKQNNNQPKQQQKQAEQKKQEQSKQQAQPKQEQQKQQAQPKQQKSVEPKQEQKAQPKHEQKPEPKAEPKSEPVEAQQPVETPQSTLISPEELAINEEEKKQEQAKKRRGGRRGGRKPKAKTTEANPQTSDGSSQTSTTPAAE